ncbi:hypothetical protein [Granulicella sp. S190]|uniref:hypothetical protein n=1 Tax=Granulicella sp. S190 TaxID=1747226 RepID=UPI00131E4FDE|nr:hypothetical protein [Granulicella sp. S190]
MYPKPPFDLSIKILRGGTGEGASFALFFDPFLEKRSLLAWFFGGEFVVECVAGVVVRPSLIQGAKVRHKFEIYF